MKLKNIHIQRMSLLDLFKYARDRGKHIFLLSIPGNLIIFYGRECILFITIRFGDPLFHTSKASIIKNY